MTYDIFSTHAPKKTRTPVDLSGKRFGCLEPTEYVQNVNKHGANAWKCLCHNCNSVVVVRTLTLTRGSKTNCGCIPKKVYGHAIPKYSIKEILPREFVQKYKSAAKRRKIDWELPDLVAESLVTQSCYYCGIAPSQRMVRRRGSGVFNGIDRKDSSIGYTKDNCVPCCKVCNFMKGTLSVNDFINKIKQIYTRMNTDDL